MDIFALFSDLTFDQIAMSAMTVIATREILIAALPDHLAGPGGSFIDTRLGDH